MNCPEGNILRFSAEAPVPKGEDQYFDQYKPNVQKVVEAQRKLQIKLMTEAKRWAFSSPSGIDSSSESCAAMSGSTKKVGSSDLPVSSSMPLSVRSRSQGGCESRGCHADVRHHHPPELLPHVPQTRGHDRYGRNRHELVLERHEEHRRTRIALTSGTSAELTVHAAGFSIENAQKRVEENNYGIRKRLLEYDDVMNKQRTSSSVNPRRSRVFITRSVANRRMSWSSNDTKNTDEPGSP